MSRTKKRESQINGGRGEIDGMSISDLIALMDVYESDRANRDQVAWDRIMKFFYAALIVIFIPNMGTVVNIHLEIAACIFPALGILMSAFFLFATVSNSMRIANYWDAYEALWKRLPAWCHLKKLSGVWRVRLNFLIPAVMFGSLMIVGVVMFIYDLRPHP